MLCINEAMQVYMDDDERPMVMEMSADGADPRAKVAAAKEKPAGKDKGAEEEMDGKREVWLGVIAEMASLVSLCFFAFFHDRRLALCM